MTTQEMLKVHFQIEEDNRRHVQDWKTAMQKEENTMENTSIITATRTPSWATIGQDVTECKSMEQVLEASGLNYHVVKRPVFYGNEWSDDVGTHELIGRYVTIRESDNHPYDVVSDKFEIVQNAEAFDFVNYMGDEVSFVKAGETASGMVYVIGKLPEVSILGDTFTPHVLFRNGFSGKVKITAAICPLRIVCQNQFNFAFRNTDNTTTIRHVQNAPQKLEEAREVLKVSASYMSQLSIMAETYAMKKLSPSGLDQVLDLMFPIKDRDTMNHYALHRLEEARTRFTKAYNADDNWQFRGTAWGMINAYTDFLTHAPAMGSTSTKDEGKFTKITFGQSMNQILTVVDAIAA